MSRLYLVRKGQRAVWVAAERDGLLYVYPPDTGQFHHSHAVTVVFFVEGELGYEPLSVEQAREQTADDVGKLDDRSMGHVLGKFRTDQHALAHEEHVTSVACPNPTSIVLE